ncbi:MAG: adenylate kinase [Thaumarchaeota archaeon]|nr:adenylate kinase [Nitrososphaerota archaeon]
MSLRVVVVGIAGVGKTTVVERVRSLLKGAELVTFGTVMLEEGKKRKWIKDRDELRKLPVVKQNQLQTMAASRISRMTHPSVLVDTHLFIRTKEGFWPGLPFDVARALKPTHLVLIEAAPEEILSRRATDTKRYRDKIAVEEVKEELELARTFLAVVSTITGAPMFAFRNSAGKADATARRIAGLLRAAK